MRVEPLTASESLSTRETVPTPTPASAATLAIVLTATLAPSSALLAPWKRFHQTKATGTCQPGSDA